MATLQRRVQILFDPAQYAALEAEAAARHQSVAAVIREAVDDRLHRRAKDKRAAWTSILTRAETDPVPPPEDWEAFKEELERDAVREL
jgi:hypothetical protein